LTGEEALLPGLTSWPGYLPVPVWITKESIELEEMERERVLSADTFIVPKVFGRY
jgi:hypothetical protein